MNYFLWTTSFRHKSSVNMLHMLRKPITLFSYCLIYHIFQSNITIGYMFLAKINDKKVWFSFSASNSRLFPKKTSKSEIFRFRNFLNRFSSQLTYKTPALEPLIWCSILMTRLWIERRRLRYIIPIPNARFYISRTLSEPMTSVFSTFLSEKNTILCSKQNVN